MPSNPTQNITLHQKIALGTQLDRYTIGPLTRKAFLSCFAGFRASPRLLSWDLRLTCFFPTSEMPHPSSALSRPVPTPKPRPLPPRSLPFSSSAFVVFRRRTTSPRLAVSCQLGMWRKTKPCAPRSRENPDQLRLQAKTQRRPQLSQTSANQLLTVMVSLVFTVWPTFRPKSLSSKLCYGTPKPKPHPC